MGKRVLTLIIIVSCISSVTTDLANFGHILTPELLWAMIELERNKWE